MGGVGEVAVELDVAERSRAAAQDDRDVGGIAWRFTVGQHLEGYVECGAEDGLAVDPDDCFLIDPPELDAAGSAGLERRDLGPGHRGRRGGGVSRGQGLALNLHAAVGLEAGGEPLGVFFEAGGGL